MPFPTAVPKPGAPEAAFPRGSLMQHIAENEPAAAPTAEDLLEQAIPFLEGNPDPACQKLVGEIRKIVPPDAGPESSEPPMAGNPAPPAAA